MKKLGFAIVLLAVFSCQTNTQPEQTLEQLDKSSAREVVLTSAEKGDTILHITKQKIWSNNELIAEKIDTLKTVKSWNDTIKAPIYVTIQ